MPHKIKETGYSGVYHALRLREGLDTTLSPKARKNSIRNFQEAGLGVGTCVEPVGPEHSNEELAEAILFTGSFNPSFSGAARRIAIPGTQMASRGMISELRLAQIVAVTRLGVPRTCFGPLHPRAVCFGCHCRGQPFLGRGRGQSARCGGKDRRRPGRNSREL